MGPMDHDLGHGTCTYRARQAELQKRSDGQYVTAARRPVSRAARDRTCSRTRPRCARAWAGRARATSARDPRPARSRVSNARSASPSSASRTSGTGSRCSAGVSAASKRASALAPSGGARTRARARARRRPPRVRTRRSRRRAPRRGSPLRGFRAVRGGEIVAYARAADLGRARACARVRAPSDGASALARLLAALTPAEHRLPVPLVRDGELGEALRAFELEHRARIPRRCGSCSTGPTTAAHRGRAARPMRAARDTRRRPAVHLLAVRPFLTPGLTRAARALPWPSHDPADPERAPSSRPYRGGRGPPGAQRLSAGPQRADESPAESAGGFFL